MDSEPVPAEYNIAAFLTEMLKVVDTENHDLEIVAGCRL